MRPEAGRPPRGALHALLDAWALPRRVPRAELVARHGAHDDPRYGWPVIAVPGALPVGDALLAPPSTLYRPDDSPHLPPVYWNALLWYGRDPLENLERAARLVAARLGPGRREDVSNTRAWGWRDGPASATLTVWPPALQRGLPHVPAHARDPRLATACTLSVETGFRPPLGAAEREALARAVPVAELPRWRARTAEDVRAERAGEGALEYVRDPGGVELEPLLGRLAADAAGTTVVACTDQLYVVPAERALRVQVARLTPAKGGGGAWMHLACRAGHAAAGRYDRRVPLAEHADTHGLDALAAAVARVLGVPLVLEEPYPDC